MAHDVKLPRVRRRRRWPWVLAIGLVLVVVLWFGVERLIQADRYRPVIAERITKATGLPAEVGHIDLTLLPVPSVHIRGVTVGEDDFKAQCDDLEAHPRLSKLTKGQLDISNVEVRGLTVTLPADRSEARSRIQAIGPAEPSSPDQRAEVGKVSVGIIRAEGARLFIGDSPIPALIGEIAVRDALSTRLGILSSGQLPILGPDAIYTTRLTVSRSGEPEMGLGVEGEARLSSVDTATLVKTRNIPTSKANVDLEFKRTGKRTFSADVHGHAHPKAGAGADLSALGGSFTAKAWWDNGTFTMNDLHWKTNDVELFGDVTVPSDGTVAARVNSLHAKAPWLNALFAFRSDLPVRLSAWELASFTAENVLLGVTEDRYFRLVEGTASFEGIDIALKSGESAFPDAHGAVSFHEGTIQVERFEAEGISLTGTVEPDFSTGITKIDLAGNADLNRERLRSVVNFSQISEATGQVDLASIRGTFVPGEGIPADLVVEGAVQNGALAIQSDAWQDRLDPLSARFTAQPGRIDTQATATSVKLGDTAVDGQYILAERRWEGTATGDLSRMDLLFLKQESARRVAPGVVAAYGESTFDMSLDLPGPDRPGVTVTFARHAEPGLSGSVAWRKEETVWVMGDVHVDAAMPAAALQPLLPSAATAADDVAVAFSRSAEANAFDARVDLTPTTLTLGDYLHKKAGDAAWLDIRGEASPSIWAARTVDVHCLGETARGHFEETRFVIDDLDLAVEPLSPLLVKGGTAKGRIRGRIATNPTEVTLTLTDVAAALSSDLVLDSVNGALDFRPEAVSVRELAIRGANSDCTINAERVQNRWSGRITGNQLDINGVEALQNAFAAYQAPADDSAPAESQSVSGEPQGEPGSQGLNGTLEVALGNLIYRQAHFKDASADIVARDGRIRVNDLQLQRGSGSIAGSIAMDPADPIGRFATELTVAEVDARVIDELAFVEPRGLEGTLSGNVILEMPTGEGINPTHGVNGNIAFTGRDGTFGKLGIATKILGVLRATEITRLRVPSLRDKGLTYDTCKGTVTMGNGLMTVQELVISTPTYLITAQGTINFPANQTDLLVHVGLLEGVWSAGDSVPGVREVTDKFRTMGGLRILVTGPPEDPQTAYGWGPPLVGEITEDVRNTLRSGGNIIRDEIVNRATDVLRDILK